MAAQHRRQNYHQSAFCRWNDALAEEEKEREALTESYDKTCARYKMEISAEKTKLITISANCIQREIKVKKDRSLA